MPRDRSVSLKEIQITEIKNGLGEFAPKPDKAVSFAALKAALRKAGYTLDSAEVAVSGTLTREDKMWWLVAEPAGQRFALKVTDIEKMLAGAAPDSRVEITGGWETVGAGAAAREVVSPRDVKKAEGATKASAAVVEEQAPFSNARFMAANFDAAPSRPFSGSLVGAEPPAPATPTAPIRVTSPGLTVYKGGAVTPCLYLVKQHLGDLESCSSSLRRATSAGGAGGLKARSYRGAGQPSITSRRVFSTPPTRAS